MLLAERSLLAILEYLPVAVVVADQNGRVIFENDQAVDTLGHSMMHVDGLPAYGALFGRTADGVPLAAEDYPLPRALRGETVAATEYRYVKPDGVDTWIRAVAAPIVEDGQIRGATVMFRNVDVEKDGAEALRAAERRLEIAMSAGRLGAWTVRLDTMTMTCTAGCKANFGRRPDARFDYADLIEAIHPDDRDHMRETVEHALATHSEYACEYRTIWPDGSIHWIDARGRAEYDELGTPTRMDGVTAEVTERRTLEETLREQADALRQADRRKDQFLAALSHELRNPLSAIMSGLQVMRLPQKSGGAPPVSRAMEVVERQVMHITRLVDDLAEISRISEGKVSLQLARVGVADIVNAGTDTLRSRVDGRRQQLTVDTTGAPMFVLADPERLTQVLVNLLSNASKYTDEGGAIHVAARPNNGFAELRIRDTGVGIPPAMQGRIFDLFTQVDEHRARSEGGLGLGLALVQRLVHLHGGTVSVSSDGHGRGSEFVVRLPLLASS